MTEVSGPSDVRCATSLTADPQAMDFDGGVVTISVSTTRDCAWTSTSEASWIRLSTSAGQGEATFTANVDPNPQITSRSGSVAVNGQRTTVVQTGRPCTFDLGSTTAEFAAAGGSGRVSVTTLAGCSWRATTNVPWIQIPTAAVSGSGALDFTVAANDASARTGILTIAEKTVVVTQAAAPPAPAPPPAPVPGPGPTPLPPNCTPVITPLTLDTSAAASTQTIQLTLDPPCRWTAASNTTWLSITSAASGTGPAAVTVAVAANTGGQRTGTLTIAGQAVTIRQTALSCTFSITPTSQSFSTAAGTGRFTVTTQSACSWTASESASWISLTTAAGTGPGDVVFSVQANPTANTRSANITVGGQTFAVSQAAVACTFTLNPTSQNLPARAGSGRFTVTSPAGCAWSASKSVPWIDLTQATGTGTGDVVFTVQANATTTARSGTITAGGRTFTVNQAGISCTYALDPAALSFTAAGGNGQFTVTSPAGCTWTAAASAPWVTINATGTSGSGTAPLSYSVQANPDQTSRSATITVGGQVHAISQAAAAPPPCTYAVSPATATVPAAGGNGQFSVTTQSGCAWTVSGGAAWVNLSAPAGGGGTGAGDVSYRVEPNADQTARMATFTVAGQTHTITQEAAPAPCTYSISPASGQFAAAGGDGRFTVTTRAGCSWTASTAEPWIALAVTGGTDTADVTFTVQANATGLARTGTIMVAGQTYTVNQAP